MNTAPPERMGPFFGSHATPEADNLKTLAAINTLFDSLSHYHSEDEIQTLEAEDHIKGAFLGLFETCDFQMAKEDFDKLLEETDGKLRSDGTIIVYHHLSAIMVFLSAVRDGTISMDQLNNHGGLETQIRIHLRHDSVEDTALTLTKFAKQIKRYALDLTKAGVFNKIRREKEFGRNHLVYQGVDLMTKKMPLTDSETREILRDPETGKILKKDRFPSNKAYIQNLVHSAAASPIVWILKQIDVIQNQGTIEAPKFPGVKRLKNAMKLRTCMAPDRGLLT